MSLYFIQSTFPSSVASNNHLHSVSNSSSAKWNKNKCLLSASLKAEMRKLFNEMGRVPPRRAGEGGE